MSELVAIAESSTLSEQTRGLVKALGSAFGSEFSVFRRHAQGWLPISPSIDNSSAQVTEEVSQWLDQIAFTGSTASNLFHCGSHRAFVAACSNSDEGDCEVVGAFVRLDAQQLAPRVLELAVNQAAIADLHSLHEQYAARLTASYEELCFLRKLSQHIEYCVGSRSLREVTNLVMAELRKLLSVEGLCLIEAHPQEECVDRHVGELVAVEGYLPRESTFWIELLEGLHHQAQQTIVRNLENPFYRSGFRDAKSVRSFILTPIRKENQLYGWLLAVNKKLPEYSTGVLSNSLADEELGSMEASLLEVAARIIGAQVSNHQMFETLEQLVVDVIQTLVGVVEAKDNYTSGHSNRVAIIARHLAEQLQLSTEQTMDIFTAGLLHDVGKIGVRDEVLNKPGPLTEAEFQEIKQHPVIGVQLLEKIKPLAKYLPGVLYHHEALDGTGYPEGLKGEQIPLMARVLAVADSLDAMTSNRSYRLGMPVAKAAAILQAGSGRQWDPVVVEAYFAAQEIINPLCNSWNNPDSPILPNKASPESSSQPTKFSMMPALSSTTPAFPEHFQT